MNLQELRQNSTECHSDALIAVRWRMLAARREHARLTWRNAAHGFRRSAYGHYRNATDELLAHEAAMPKALLWAMWSAFAKASADERRRA